MNQQTLNDLFEGELTDDDKLVYVNHVLKGKLIESDLLRQQAVSNTKGLKDIQLGPAQWYEALWGT